MRVKAAQLSYTSRPTGAGSSFKWPWSPGQQCPKRKLRCAKKMNSFAKERFVSSAVSLIRISSVGRNLPGQRGNEKWQGVGYSWVTCSRPKKTGLTWKLPSYAASRYGDRIWTQRKRCKFYLYPVPCSLCLPNWESLEFAATKGQNKTKCAKRIAQPAVKNECNWVRWHNPEIPARWRWRKKHQGFKGPRAT